MLFLGVDFNQQQEHVLLLLTFFYTMKNTFTCHEEMIILFETEYALLG